MKTLLLSAAAVSGLLLAAPAFANCSKQAPSAANVRHETTTKPARTASRDHPVYQQFAGHGHDGGGFQVNGDY
jgi:hypothetical protein